MNEELPNFTFQKKPDAEIKVIGVGGGGGNAVNHMYEEGIHEVDFVICNTDAQAMEASPVTKRVQLGASLTEGRGAGNKPQIGEQAALENIDDVKRILSGKTKMVFITAGMGGGTGTGGAPVIAKACKEEGYLTVGIVTIPFRNEGRRRIKQAADGIAELEKYVDSLLVINNERIRDMYGDFGISKAFAKADDILATAAKGIAEIITVPGYINVDFADVETVMRNSGRALMGTGIADGEDRAINAIENALNSPLLNNNDIRGAKDILINITSGNNEVTMAEIDLIIEFVQNKAAYDANIIWGNGKEESLDDKLSVTIIATNFGQKIIPDTETGENTITKEETPGGGKTVDFDIGKEEQNEEKKFEALYPSTAKARATNSVLQTSHNYAELSDEEVDAIENVPAYKRRHTKMSNSQAKKEKSHLSVNSENKISDKNQYLHNQVD